MKTTFVTLAALAAMGFAGAAYAGDATTGTSATGPAAMSDSEMDKVTAGAIGGTPGANWNFGQAYGKPGNCRPTGGSISLCGR